MSKAFVFYLRSEILEKSCSSVCVSVLHTTFRCFFYIGLVCVPGCKHAGVWLVILKRPKWCHARGLVFQIS